MKKIKKLLMIAIAGAIFFMIAGCSSKQSEDGFATMRTADSLLIK